MPENICVKFYLKILLCKYNRCSKQPSGTSWGEQTFEWFSWFIRVNNSVEHCEHSGCPSKWCSQENIAKGCNIMKEQQNTISEISGRLGLLYGTHQLIPREDLNMWQTSTNFLPWLLTDVQKQLWFLATHSPHLPHLVTHIIFSSVGKWIFSYYITISTGSWSSQKIADCCTCHPKM